jgi:tRNA U34 5-methylaminomethyl-2-thiouridine-forming methyltransferase MnmC
LQIVGDGQDWAFLMFQIVPLSGGLHTLRDLETGETFHPVIGPMAEAEAVHLAPHKLATRIRPDDAFVIWDVGLGAGANAVAALNFLSRLDSPARCELHSFECTLDPLNFALENLDTLTYLKPWRTAIEELKTTGKTTIGERLSWQLHFDHFPALDRNRAPQPDAVMYDPYSPTSNPEMWSLEHFASLRQFMTKPATLSSYSRSTAVRVTLLLAGFYVGIGGATGEKEETTVAATVPDLLDRPLSRDWRVRASTNARPISAPRGKISGEDFEKLRTHPQFG